MNYNTKYSSIIPELKVCDFDKSLDFYLNIACFTLAYKRSENDFAMLEINGAQLMIEGLNNKSRSWTVGDMEHPFGRGMHLQIEVINVNLLYQNFKNNKWPIFFDMEERSYRVNDTEIKQRQFLVQDPDGYLLRFFEKLNI